MKAIYIGETRIGTAGRACSVTNGKVYDVEQYMDADDSVYGNTFKFIDDNGCWGLDSKNRFKTNIESVGCSLLTERQKLLAMAHKYYNHQEWIPQKGDYYTSSRADLELYQVVDVTDTKVCTIYVNGSGTVSEWDKETFLTEGFGINRVHVPKFVFTV